MRILLVNPGVGFYNEQPPIGLLYLAASVRKDGYDVKICNRPCGDSYERMVEEFKPDFVGITGTTQAIQDAYRVSEYCRSKGIWTIIGGIHASACPEEAIKHCDTVITGEGEITILDTIRCPVRGIFKGVPYTDLDQLPLPAWDLIDMNYYTSRVEGILSFALNSKVGCLLTSRGCPYKCTYCYNTMRTAKVRYASPKRVIEEIQNLIDNYHVNTIVFLEDNFFVNKDRVKEICRRIKLYKLKFLWSANGRVDNIDPDILKMAHEAGCVQIAFGMESASQRILDVLKKGTKISDMENAVKLCDDAGIIVSASFMFGNPTEKVEDIMKTVEFIRDNNVDGPLGFCITMPFPGTELWKWCEDNDRVPKDIDWSNFDYNRMPIRVSDIPMEILGPMLNVIRYYTANKFNERALSRMKKVGIVYESCFSKPRC
jgi:anaerobic magnesium-protoporphyrin IX monomethyl ester cyclase